MSNNLYEIKKKEFIDFINANKRLPRTWESKFSTNEDMRIWFNKIEKQEKFKSFIDEVSVILTSYDIKILDDKDKELEFLEYIKKANRIPLYGESYFSDEDEMTSWYMRYKSKNNEYEEQVHKGLKEYNDFVLEEKWSNIKTEFIEILKKIKKIPNHGEVILQDGIDFRVVYDKLTSYDPSFSEKILLHLETYNKKGLEKDKRKEELLTTISELGYIPTLQEYRFSDGTDMFTWYTKYKNIIDGLEKDVLSKVIKDNPNKKINIYLIPNFKSTGGKFYTVCSNEGEVLDLSNVDSFEEAKVLDDSLVKRGGIILKKDEEIGSVNYFRKKNI